MNALILGFVIVVGHAGSAAPPATGGCHLSPASFSLARAVQAYPVEVLSERSGSAPAFAPTQAFRRPVRTNPKFEAAVVGAAIGLVAGGVAGYLVANSDDCDTCALRGISIGAPIGATIGAIMGFRSR